MFPCHSVTVFDLGFRSGNTRAFLDQVDMGINTGGLVRVDQQSLEAELDNLQGERALLRAEHDAASMELQDLSEEEGGIIASITKLRQNLEGHVKVAEHEWARRHTSVAVGFDLTIKRLRIELAVRVRESRQKVKNLVGLARKVRQKMLALEFKMLQTEAHLRIIALQLRPVRNLADALGNV